MKGSARGNTLTEYSILLGLVAVAGIAAVVSLGDSLDNLVGANGIAGRLERLSSPGATQLQTGTLLNKGSVSLQGVGFEVMSRDPVTGEPILVTTKSNGGASNATSVDGDQWSSEGSARLAQELDDLALVQTDADASTWMSEMAKLAYFQGGAEGMLEGQQLSPFDPSMVAANMNGQEYTAANAVTDLKTYQAQLKNLMQNAPASVSQADRTRAVALASDAYNIAQTYATQHASAVDPNVSPGGAPFDRLLSLDTLKADARAKLAANQVNADSVKIVLSDAGALDGN